MRGTVTSTRTRPARVWLHQLSSEALSSAAPDLMWLRLSLHSPVFAAVRTATAPQPTFTVTFCHQVLSLHSGLSNPFLAHRRGDQHYLVPGTSVRRVAGLKMLCTMPLPGLCREDQNEGIEGP